MTDVTVKVKLPEGIRFVSTESIPGIEADFDGAEVTFLPVLSKHIRVGDVLRVKNWTEFKAS